MKLSHLKLVFDFNFNQISQNTSFYIQKSEI
jgi:hypothetical protein